MRHQDLNNVIMSDFYDYYFSSKFKMWISKIFHYFININLTQIFMELNTSL